MGKSGRKQIIAVRRGDKFARWVRDFGISQVAEKLRVTRQAVWLWVTLQRRPKRTHLAPLVKLGVGEFTKDDVTERPYLHRKELGRPQKAGV